MTNSSALHTPLLQQALSLGLAVVVTAGLLAGTLGLAAGDQDALMARQATQPMQATASLQLPGHA